MASETSKTAHTPVPMSAAYTALMMAGPLRNGNEFGGGVTWHAVPRREEADRRGFYDNERALCGRFPSIMWSNHQPPGRNITCPRCVSKIRRGSASKQEA